MPADCDSGDGSCFGATTQQTCEACDGCFALDAAANTCTATACTTPCATTIAYRYLRWTITKRRAQLAYYNSFQASEFQLQDQGQPVFNQYAGVTVTNPGGSSPGNESPAMIYDNNVDTKWYDRGSL